MVLSACFFRNSTLSLCDIDEKFPFWWNCWLWGLVLGKTFCHAKVVRLHARLHDAAGVVPSHSDKDPEYCYMIGRGLIPCLLCDVTGLLLCLQIKLLLPSIFNSVDFWSSMSCIVLDIVFADKNSIMELGFFIDGNVQWCSFCPPTKYRTTEQAFWYTRNLHWLVWNSRCEENSELSFFLPRAVKGNYFAKETERGKSRVTSFEIEVQTKE